MTSQPSPDNLIRTNHELWVRTRLQLDAEFLEALRHGFSLIAAGFGSFSIFQGLTVGERVVSELPKTFALIVTAVGVLVILLAITHDRKMTAWVDGDEFGTEPVPELPDENRPLYLAAGGAIIGLVSFVALLLLPS
jgi:uncharacterized membrane protein YidH (DUF202 family)